MNANGYGPSAKHLPVSSDGKVNGQSPVDIIPTPVTCNNSHETDYLQLILSSKVYGLVETTPLTIAGCLSDQLGCNVLFKREDLQLTSSYKIRGIYNKMAHINENERWRGVIACSNGSDVLAVACSARKLRMASIIVVPLGVPEARRQHLSRLGSKVILHGEDLDAAMDECSRLQKLHQLTYVSASGDPYVIAGHGTIGLEILSQAAPYRVKAIFCPVDCGALIVGLGIYVKRVAPHIKIIGVEGVENDASDKSYLVPYKGQQKAQGDGPQTHKSDDMIRLCTEVIDEIVQVDMEEILIAVKDGYEDTRHVLDFTGAIAVAGLKQWVTSNGLRGSGMDFIAITSEANLDFFAIPEIIKCAAVAEHGREIRVDALGQRRNV